MENSNPLGEDRYPTVHLDEKAALRAEINRTTTKGELQASAIPPEHANPKRPIWRRLVRIALTASACYWLVNALDLYPGEPFDVSDSDALHYSVAELTGYQFQEEWYPLDHPHPPHDGDADCGNLHDAQWTYLDTFSETTTWNLSTSADKIKIFTRGPIAGNLTFTSGKTVGDDIEVDVKVVKAPRGCPHAKEEDPAPPTPPKPLVKVCPFKSKDGKFEGLGIFAIPPRRRHGPPPPPHDPHDPDRPHPPPGGHPHHPLGDDVHYGPPIWARHIDIAPPPPPPPPPPPRHPRRHPKPVLVSVDIRLPTSSSLATSTLALRHFELAFPRFKIDVGDIKATFEYLLLLSAHASVTVKDVSAAVISVISPGGNITGSFAVSKQIDVISVGHTVDVNLALHSAAHEKPFNATKARIINRFGPINANVSLVASSESTSNFPPTYVVESNNVKGSTNITYLSQPLNSTLFVSAVGIGARATIKTDPAFQGAFDLESPGSRPILFVPEDTKDPWGGNNKRVVHLSRGWKWWSLRGIVFWKAPETIVHPPKEGTDAPLSRIKIFTKGAPASLLLG